jgi:hypothetical protein
MDSIVEFLFRGKLYSAEVFFDTSAMPFYIFCLLYDADLVSEFGQDLTIKTDLEKLLPKKDDCKELVELRQAIFNAARNTSEFQKAKAKDKAKV